MFSGFNGMDPNSVNALVQSSQQQQNQRGGKYNSIDSWFAAIEV
jgi:hypothetical protein